MFVLVIVMFALVIVSGIPSMASYAVAIGEAVDTTFEFLPLIALIGALLYLGKGKA